MPDLPVSLPRANEILIGLAQALCFALAGFGSAVVATLLIWADLDVTAVAWQTAIVFLCVWVVFFRAAPFKFSKDLMQTIGAGAGTFLLIAVLARGLYDLVHPVYSAAARDSWAALVSVLSSVAGCWWGRVVSRSSSIRFAANKAIRVIAFVGSLFVASVALGTGIGCLAGFANQLGGPGYLVDAALLGCLAGPLLIPHVHTDPPHQAIWRYCSANHPCRSVGCGS